LLKGEPKLKKLVIGQFSEAFPPLMDGVGIVVKNYTTLLKEQGHQVHAVVSGTSLKEGYDFDLKEQLDYTIRFPMVPVVGIKPYGVVVKSKKIKDIVDKIDFDIIHTHAPFFLASYAKTFKRPTISTFHTLYKDEFYTTTHSHTITKHLVNSILKYYQDVDEIWTPTKFSRQKLYQYGLDKEVIVMDNGCDFKIPSLSEFDYYKKWGLRYLKNLEKSPTLLYVGQIKKEKNLELLINALPIVKKSFHNFKMVFVGDGNDKEYFIRLLENLKLTKNVFFTGKITDRELLKALYACSDLFLFPSQYDTSALVVKEAAAFSLPTLNTVGSATALATTEGYNGFVCENNSSSYGNKIISLLNNKTLLKEVGLNAQRTIYKSWDSVIEKVEDRYYNLIELNKN
jgi:1,2-diacylglycerol 3-alpha-glucosyltransferase